MAIGFPYARYRLTRTFNLDETELHRAIESALSQLHWRYHVEWGSTYKAWIPTTGWSWHHDFTLVVKPGGVLEAESKSAYQELIFDLGRNKRHVQEFFTQLEQVTHTTGA